MISIEATCFVFPSKSGDRRSSGGFSQDSLDLPSRRIESLSSPDRAHVGLG